MPSRRGFTLIELMVTLTIIGLLASMLVFGMAKAQSRAQSSRTKSTIMKIHGLLMRRNDSYYTRRVPVDVRGMAPKYAGELRLVALRQLMRFEMPMNWAEVCNADGTVPTTPALTRIQVGPGGEAIGTTLGVTMSRPALADAYVNYYNNTSKAGATAYPGAVSTATGYKPSVLFQDAECLYMIITLGAMDEGSGREMFSESEIGDVDKDGAPEFIDAWGMPIRFVRWPVGFVDDPGQEATAQTTYVRTGHLSDLMPALTLATATTVTPSATGDNHDPLDTRRIDSVAFRIFPLVYSAGPDTIPDIYTGGATTVYDDPYAAFRSGTITTPHNPLSGTATLMGIPWDLPSNKFGVTSSSGNGALNHSDNIHNHRIDATIK